MAKSVEQHQEAKTTSGKEMPFQRKFSKKKLRRNLKEFKAIIGVSFDWWLGGVGDDDDD